MTAFSGGGAAGFLGGLARIGRWNAWGIKAEAPHELAVRAMAVVAGRYPKRLKQAEEEASTIRKTYGATAVRAELPSVMRCLRGVEPPPVEALHFAVHGVFDPAKITKNGLLLVDSEFLLSQSVNGLRKALERRPLVFLNDARSPPAPLSSVSRRRRRTPS